MNDSSAVDLNMIVSVEFKHFEETQIIMTSRHNVSQIRFNPLYHI